MSHPKRPIPPALQHSPVRPCTVQAKPRPGVPLPPVFKPAQAQPRPRQTAAFPHFHAPLQAKAAPKNQASPLRPPPYRSQQVKVAQRKGSPHRIPGMAALQPPRAAVNRPLPGGVAVIQRSSNDYAEDLLEESKDSGARLKSKEKEWIDLDTVKRTTMSWFSKSIQSHLGIPPKPKNGSICPMCGKAKSGFELDHMTPWRHYVAALMSPQYVKNGLVRADVAKALYNDAENLWWICHDCNNPKSDIIPETSAHASGDFSSGTYGRSGLKPSSFF